MSIRYGADGAECECIYKRGAIPFPANRQKSDSKPDSIPIGTIELTKMSAASSGGFLR
ncbi:MAG: hypothetical protein ACLQAT_13875 [Candidatus Binataceae bacterium]